MKRLILFFIVMAAFMPIVLANNPPPNALFEYPVVQCDADGSLMINVSHVGSQIRIENISIKAVEKNSNLETVLVGNWTTKSGFFLENYTPNSLLDRSFLVFRSNVTLPGKGDYLFEMTWPVPRNPWSNKLVFAGSCPGNNCSVDGNCATTQNCVSGECEIVKCSLCEVPRNHRCSFKCDDFDSSTTDSCDAGACTHEKTTGSCRSSSDCDDGKQCTEDVCVSNKCMVKPVKCLASIDPCIKGACEEGVGCMYKTEDTCQLRQNSLLFRIINLFKGIFS